MFLKIQIILLSNILKIILYLIFFSCKWKVLNKDSFLKAVKSKQPLLLCCWHSRLVFVAQYFKNAKFNIWAISSSHRDSEIMAKILYKWGWGLIRGSSTRGWRNVIKKMMVLLKDPSTIIAITNDGPKGPPKQAKPGSIELALKYNAQIMSISCHATRFWRLRSWDKTIIPKPFSTIFVQFNDPLSISSNNIQKETSLVNDYLNSNLSQLKAHIRGMHDN